MRLWSQDAAWSLIGAHVRCYALIGAHVRCYALCNQLCRENSAPPAAPTIPSQILLSYGHGAEALGKKIFYDSGSLNGETPADLSTVKPLHFCGGFTVERSAGRSILEAHPNTSLKAVYTFSIFNLSASETRSSL